MAQTLKLPSFNDLKQTKGLPSFQDIQIAAEKKKAGITQADKPAETQKKKKKVDTRRPRAAKTLDIFKKQVFDGHALFYRYIRLADSKNEGLAGPRGGACILVNMIDDKQFRFSFAVCSPVDPFIKDEARKLCQERYSKGITCTITNRDPAASCYENVKRAIENWLYAVNKELNEPGLTINSKAITPQHLKLLVKFIDIKLDDGV